MQHSIPADHAQHDLDLIAGHAAGNLSVAERMRADAMLQSCPACTELRRDLVAIAAATRALPRRATAPRDFRLTAGDAVRLRRGGWPKAFLRPFAAPRSTLRPMAMAFTSLGLAGLLVANALPSLLGGSAALAPERDMRAGAGAASAPSQQPVALPVAGKPGATGQLTGKPAATNQTEFGAAEHQTPPADDGTKANQAASNPPDVALGGGNVAPTSVGNDGRLDANPGASTDGTSAALTAPLLIGSLVLLLVGLVLLALQFAARRVR